MVVKRTVLAIRFCRLQITTRENVQTNLILTVIRRPIVSRILNTFDLYIFHRVQISAKPSRFKCLSINLTDLMPFRQFFGLYFGKNCVYHQNTGGTTTRPNVETVFIYIITYKRSVWRKRLPGNTIRPADSHICFVIV